MTLITVEEEDEKDDNVDDAEDEVEVEDAEDDEVQGEEDDDVENDDVEEEDGSQDRDLDFSQKQFCTRIFRKKTRAQMEHPERPFDEKTDGSIEPQDLKSFKTLKATQFGPRRIVDTSAANFIFLQLRSKATMRKSKMFQLGAGSMKLARCAIPSLDGE